MLGAAIASSKYNAIPISDEINHRSSRPRLTIKIKEPAHDMLTKHGKCVGLRRVRQDVALALR